MFWPTVVNYLDGKIVVEMIAVVGSQSVVVPSVVVVAVVVPLKFAY